MWCDAGGFDVDFGLRKLTLPLHFERSCFGSTQRTSGREDPAELIAEEDYGDQGEDRPGKCGYRSNELRRAVHWPSVDPPADAARRLPTGVSSAAFPQPELSRLRKVYVRLRERERVRGDFRHRRTKPLATSRESRDGQLD